MLDLLMPEALRDTLETAVAAHGGSGWRRSLFAVLTGMYLLALGWLLRAGALRLDLWLADRSRGRGREPGAAAFAMGRFGVAAPWIAGIAGLTLLLAEIARSPLLASHVAADGGLRWLVPIARGVSRFFLS